MVTKQAQSLVELRLQLGHPLFERAKSILFHCSSFLADHLQGAPCPEPGANHPTDTLRHRQSRVGNIYMHMQLEKGGFP